jgi:hypothetical protein
VADRAQRTADFRALFADSLTDRTEAPGSVEWTLRATPAAESESRRLAALEERCCDGIRFAVTRQGDSIVWRITGPPSAQGTLQALYHLPVAILDDAEAEELWATLDAGACAPRKHA